MIWVPVSTVSVADAGRMYLWPCGSNQAKAKSKGLERESDSSEIEAMKRGVESAQTVSVDAV